MPTIGKGVSGVLAGKSESLGGVTEACGVVFPVVFPPCIRRPSCVLIVALEDTPPNGKVKYASPSGSCHGGQGCRYSVAWRLVRWRDVKTEPRIKILY